MVKEIYFDIDFNYRIIARSSTRSGKTLGLSRRLEVSQSYRCKLRYEVMQMCGALNNYYYEGAEYNDNCYYNKVLVNINIEVLINC